MKNTKRKLLNIKSLNVAKVKKSLLGRQGGDQKLQKIGYKKLEAKLALPNKLTLIYLEITNKVTLIRSCKSNSIILLLVLYRTFYKMVATMKFCTNYFISSCIRILSGYGNRILRTFRGYFLVILLYILNHLDG